MGIDAELLIRYRGPWPSDEDLTRWSWNICQAIGAKHFWIQDGLPPDEYAQAENAWHEAFQSHPLYRHWQSGDCNNQIGDNIRKDIGSIPGVLRRAIELTNRIYPLEDDSDVPTEYHIPGRAWVQDGPPVLADEGECFMEVSLRTRYYGSGYERGDILTICAIAEWIEVNMHPCEVWYGGDSSGVLAEPFDVAKRTELKAHLYSQAGRNYYANFEKRGTFPTPKPCGLCVPGENRFNRYGWGASYIAVGCDGCGKKFTSRDNGANWVQDEDRY